MQNQSLDKKYIVFSKYFFIVVSFYQNIGCQNHSCDKSLKAFCFHTMPVTVNNAAIG
jgi:hypothetical protein